MTLLGLSGALALVFVSLAASLVALVSAAPKEFEEELRFLKSLESDFMHTGNDEVVALRATPHASTVSFPVIMFISPFSSFFVVLKNVKKKSSALSIAYYLPESKRR